MITNYNFLYRNIKNLSSGYDFINLEKPIIYKSEDYLNARSIRKIKILHNVYETIILPKVVGIITSGSVKNIYGSHKINFFAYIYRFDDFLYTGFENSAINLAKYVTVNFRHSTSYVSLPKEIILPNNFGYIPVNFLLGCKILESITLPKNFTKIPDRFMNDCEDLKSITLPEKLLSIGNRFMVLCQKLETIILPDSLITIGDDFLFYCKELKSVTLSKNLKSYGHNFLKGCSKLESIYMSRKSNLPISKSLKNKVKYID